MIKRISLDAMGGDFGPSVVVPAAIQALSRYSDLHLILVGDEATINQELSKHPSNTRISIHHASQKVEMDESPASALKNKKDSSMRVAINLVKTNEVDACVSAGNTGALMATARFVLKMLPGIDRPCIASVLPTTKGHCHMLDLGANVDSTAEQLVQFAIMGSILVEAVDGIEKPGVGLLNIGAESIKGNVQVKEAAALLTGENLNYVGFVEGDDVWAGKVELVVCDGFVGNVALKTSEGVAKMISFFLRREINRNIFTKIAGLFALPIFNALKKQVDPRRYNGASFLGLKGIVVKSHGGADDYAFLHAIDEAVKEISKNVPQQISDQVSDHLADRKQA